MPTAKVSPVKILTDLGVDATKLKDDKGYLQALMRATNALTNENPNDQRIPLLQREVKRVRALRFAASKATPAPKQKVQPKTPKVPTGPKVSAQKVATAAEKSKVTPPPGTKIDPKKVVPPDNVSKENAQKINANTERQDKAAQFNSTVLAPALKKISDNFGDILGGFRDQKKADAKRAREQAKRDDRAAKKAREEKLETAQQEDDSSLKKATDTIKDKAGGMFDKIGNFFKNILVGGAIVGLLKIIKNPKILLNPFINAINLLTSTINFVVKIFVDAVSMPFKALFKGINAGWSFLTGAWNKAIKNLPFVGDKLQIPDLKLPEDWGAPVIPKIPIFKAEEPPTQKLEEGGQVTNTEVTNNVEKIREIQLGGERNEEAIRTAENIREGKDKPYQTVQSQDKGGATVNAKDISIKDGGKVTPQSGIKITGMGPDTQLVAAQPGEVMFSKSAVDHYGADKLLAMNKEGGGDNQPRYGNTGDIQSAKGGGSIEVKGDGSGWSGLLTMKDSKGKQVGPTYPAVSGQRRYANTTQKERKYPNKKNSMYPMPDGSWPLHGFQEHGPLGGALSGLGDWSTFINGKIGQRDGLMLHQDINSDGTAGCIGVELGGVAGTKAEQAFLDIYKSINPTNITVDLGDGDGSGGPAAAGGGGAAPKVTGDNSLSAPSKSAAKIGSSSSSVSSPGPSPKKDSKVALLGSGPSGAEGLLSSSPTTIEDVPPMFPSVDVLNPELGAIKSIYNIIGC